jgi:hypothetical protein
MKGKEKIGKEERYLECVVTSKSAILVLFQPFFSMHPQLNGSCRGLSSWGCGRSCRFRRRSRAST